MILERLTIENFRVFEGRHTFDLAPRVKDGKKRPIVLFGGLNGSGKTTILTAVRLALYGKLSLGMRLSSKVYEEHLRKFIHRSKARAADEESSASVQIGFSYASLGVKKHYVVTRSWLDTGKRVKEILSVEEDGVLLEDLNHDQCQGFLNELVPIGVSELFFFDGEKIAELAEDTNGEVLGDAVKKLLGLDLFETLDADLGVLLRNEVKKSSEKDLLSQINHLQDQLKEFKKKAEEELVAYEQLKPQVIETQNTLTKLETELSAKGGAWAVTREEAIREQVALSEEQKQLQERLREVIADTFPFTLAQDFVQKTLRRLKVESDRKRNQHIAEAVRDRLLAVQERLHLILGPKEIKELEAVVSEELASLSVPGDKAPLVHDISDRVLAQIESVINSALEHGQALSKELAKRLEVVEEQLDRAGQRIARAPEEDQIKPLVERIRAADEALRSARLAQKKHLEHHKSYLLDAVGVARQLDKVFANKSSNESKARVVQNAYNAKGLLKDFAEAATKRKIADLENEFVLSFERLARKEDVHLCASIDPTTFAVILHRPDGVEVDKDELSAGEKQIFAISILEALARISGRQLPIIIDTPLGRLDSVHRTKLIERYFPNASHQVIILSTDTEVDESFYKDLSPSISHAFKLEYLPESGSTTAQEGYFWLQKSDQTEVA